MKMSWFILPLIFGMVLAQQQTVDVIYLNDGRVVKGEIISGGKSSDYYVQIKTETEYLNFYMTDVREIKTSEADVNKPPPAVKEKSQSVRADPLVKLIEDTGQAKSDTRPGKQAKALKKARRTSSGNFFILPRVGYGFHSEGGGLIFGGSIGYGADPWGSIGADIMLLSGDKLFGVATMLVYEKPYRQFLLQGGIGFTSVEGESHYYDYNLDYYYDKDDDDPMSSFGLRLGIGYEFPIGKHFVLKPAYELIFGLKEKSGFSGINLNFGWK
jgi:hypothetical protein